MSNRPTSTTNELTERRSVEGHDAARVLTLLSADDSAVVTMAALREDGVRAPAQAIYELELDGYEIDRVPCASSDRNATIGYRLRTSAAISSRSVLREVRGDGS
jgi:hypothetical protein